jgi:hypothetical protein
MRTRVVSVAGLLSFGCAAAAWADSSVGTTDELIRSSLVPAVTLAIGVLGGWLLGHRGVRRWRMRVDAAVAALNEAQAQLVRKEQLAMLGQLGGSVGHELRNPLGD